VQAQATTPLQLGTQHPADTTCNMSTNSSTAEAQGLYLWLAGFVQAAWQATTPLRLGTQHTADTTCNMSTSSARQQQQHKQ
jgi:hypothetical protein